MLLQERSVLNVDHVGNPKGTRPGQGHYNHWDNGEQNSLYAFLKMHHHYKYRQLQFWLYMFVKIGDLLDLITINKNQ